MHEEHVVAAYADCGGITGPPIDAEANVVSFRRTVVGAQRRTLYVLVAASAGTELVFLTWLLSPAHWSAAHAPSGVSGALGVVAFGAIVVVEGIRLVHALTLWVFS